MEERVLLHRDLDCWNFLPAERDHVLFPAWLEEQTLGGKDSPTKGLDVPFLPE